MSHDSSPELAAGPVDLAPAPPLCGAAPSGLLRSLVRRAKSGTFRTAAQWMGRLLGPRRAEAFGILMYHRVAEQPRGLPEPTWNVTPARLREQLSGLRERGFEPWSLGQALDAYEAGEPIPRKAFVVTFDDGYENNITLALPILQELQVPATIFLATQYLDSVDPFPSDDWTMAGSRRAPLDSWRPLSTEQCLELQASGLIELGAHTHSHGDFRGRPKALRHDLAICFEVLRNKFGIEHPTFAFPYGTVRLGFAGGSLAEAAREAGARCGLSTESELIGPERNPFEWGRFTAEQKDTAATLAGKLGGWFGFPRLRRLRESLRNSRRQPA
ncbi:polysaccharide deacetylase family protein [Lignipirellula cremea]|uniref:Poly-beta-1,6-N-acetyl-D-glucosamine N-deacetylase n=1 Tax=Lignipirellula cremea TaxID=2528010 RepID=A0A518DMJ7_9BACT|nr:polysaccharide deacetylase family protein [Lignipirellula cremea]QDU93059.1 Poly-beta-1,6-N-acetyl-D-glucosamine N-deacetylase precursor [Lignipirellula cremea]